VEAARGTRLRCHGWRQEGLLRMLENTVENGERPGDLIIYGGTAQAARDWRCFDTIVAALKDLGDDETLLVQSGKPVARFPTTRGSPRVLTANSHLVGRFATWDTFYELKERGLTSPYLRAFVVARINPLRFIKGQPPSYDELLETMTKRARGMDPARIKSEDLARSGGAPEE